MRVGDKGNVGREPASYLVAPHCGRVRQRRLRLKRRHREGRHRRLGLRRELLGARVLHVQRESAEAQENRHCCRENLEFVRKFRAGSPRQTEQQTSDEQGDADALSDEALRECAMADDDEDDEEVWAARGSVLPPPAPPLRRSRRPLPMPP